VSDVPDPQPKAARSATAATAVLMILRDKVRPPGVS
jgi:hypothetical protein